MAFQGTPADPVIVIRGRGFGPAPGDRPDAGRSRHLEISDWRTHPEGHGPSGTWLGGITYRIAAWSDDSIMVQDFGGTFGQGPNTLQPDDPVTIQVWSTLGQYPFGPQTAWGGRVGRSH